MSGPPGKSQVLLVSIQISVVRAFFWQASLETTWQIPSSVHAMVGYHGLSYIVLSPLNFCYHFDGVALI